MPYAVLEKEIQRLDETQQNTVALFVRFLLSQKAAAPVEGGGARPRRYDFSRVAHFKNMADPSGRAVEGVHADSYHEGHKF